MKPKKPALICHVPVVRHLWVRPRLAVGGAIGLILFFGILPLLLPTGLPAPTRGVLAWDGGILTYLVLVAWLMAKSDTADIKAQSAAQDEGRLAILLMTIVAVLASLVAIGMELGGLKDLPGSTQAFHVAVAGATIFLSWTFMHTIFGIHYAHEYYGEPGEEPSCGLDFPGNEKDKLPPDYWDFMYFSFIIGVAVQTADVNISSRTLRRISLLHSIIGFFFNTIILALTINIGASLF